MTLSPSDRKNIILYRKERAYQTLEEARYNAAASFWNLVANRFYYAVFYICEALLLNSNIPINSHRGLIRMMGLNFIKTGILSQEEGDLLGKLFRMRQEGDYDDLLYWTKEEIMPLFPQVEALIKKIDNLIQIEDM